MTSTSLAQHDQTRLRRIAASPHPHSPKQSHELVAPHTHGACSWPPPPPHPRHHGSSSDTACMLPLEVRGCDMLAEAPAYGSATFASVTMALSSVVAHAWLGCRWAGTRTPLAPRGVIECDMSSHKHARILHCPPPRTDAGGGTMGWWRRGRAVWAGTPYDQRHEAPAPKKTENCSVRMGWAGWWQAELCWQRAQQAAVAQIP